VPQSDATLEYDGQLLDLLPLLHVLIMNETEATHITRIPFSDPNTIKDMMHTYWQNMAHFFHERNPQLYVIVTLGDQGAVVLQNGSIMGHTAAPVSFQHPVDATGAGDAFAAGFLFGSLYEKKEKGTTNHPMFSVQDILHGMDWGCLTGTSCTMRPGASIPATQAELLNLKQGRI
jgi:sugar/nucleoside kinase (ribokinase family)